MRQKYHETRRRFRELCEILGGKFLCMVILIEHLFQGFLFGGGASGIIGAPVIYLLKNYGSMTAARIQVLRTVAISPWALKPLFGMISDTVYLGGFNKLPYLLLTLITSIISCFAISFIWPLSPNTLTVLLFLIFLQMAVSDLFIEARYTSITANHTRVGPDLQSFINIGLNLAQVCSILLVGGVISWIHVDYLHYIYLLPIPFLFLALYPIYHNWLGEREYRYELGPGAPRLTNLLVQYGWYQLVERRVDSVGTVEEVSSPLIPVVAQDTEKILENKRIFLLCLIVTFLSLSSSAIGLLEVPTLVLFIFSIVSSVVMIISFFLLMERRVAMIQTFAIIQNMFSISADSAAFFFYTDSPEQYPEGPHFSNTFYVTWMGLIAVGFSIVSTVLYNLFMTKWKFRNILLCSNLLTMLVSLPTIFFFLRWNLLVGLPDEVFVLGSEALAMITSGWTYMPMSLMMYQLCPEGMEATVFALLAGTSNLGGSLSQYQGAYVLELLGVNPSGAKGETRQFENLWLVQLIAILLSLVPMATIFFLIPDASQTESIMGGGGTLAEPKEEEDMTNTEIMEKVETLMIFLEESDHES